MSKISVKDLEARYARYVRVVKRIMKEEHETEKRAIAKAALELNVDPRTVANAMKNRPSRARKQ